MAGVKGRSGRISTPEQHARRVDAARKGGLATQNRFREEHDVALTETMKAKLAGVAKELGFDTPQTVADAIKLEDYRIKDEKRQALAINREFLQSSRLPVELVDDFSSRLTLMFIKALDTVHHALDECIEFTEDQQVIIRRKLREWSEGIRISLSQEEIYERQQSVPTKSGESEQSLDQTEEEIPIEED
jgi:hypothetical protein